jgi:hypothetical protein
MRVILSFAFSTIVALLTMIVISTTIDEIYAVQEVAGPLIVNINPGETKSFSWGLLPEKNESNLVKIYADGNGSEFLSFPERFELVPGKINYVLGNVTLPFNYPNSTKLDPIIHATLSDENETGNGGGSNAVNVEVSKVLSIMIGGNKTLTRNFPTSLRMEQQDLPIGFATRGTINSLITTPTTKWIATGNWSMNVNAGNLTAFETNMAWYNSSGTAAHTHEFLNFKTDKEKVISFQQPGNDISIKGVMDVGTNQRVVWKNVPSTIDINGKKTITISVDDNKTNHHFASQPILGVVTSFVLCSDLPGPNMEVLPPCTMINFQENNFSPSNATSAGPPSESFIPSQEGMNNEGGSFPSEDTQSQGSVPSQDVSNCEQLRIKNIKSSGFETDPTDYHPPSDAIDGDSSTWWSNQGKNSQLKIDLGEPKLLCGISVEWNKGDVRKYNFEVTVSEDGNEFKKVFEGTNQGGPSMVETYNIDEIKGQYLNLAVISNSAKGWVSIKEIGVIGRPIG